MFALSDKRVGDPTMRVSTSSPRTTATGRTTARSAMRTFTSMMARPGTRGATSGSSRSAPPRGSRPSTTPS